MSLAAGCAGHTEPRRRYQTARRRCAVRKELHRTRTDAPRSSILLAGRRGEDQLAVADICFAPSGLVVRSPDKTLRDSVIGAELERIPQQPSLRLLQSQAALPAVSVPRCLDDSSSEVKLVRRVAVARCDERELDNDSSMVDASPISCIGGALRPLNLTKRTIGCETKRNPGLQVIGKKR